MRRFSFTLCTAFLLGASRVTAAQGGSATPIVLTGTVIEDASRAPVPRANVRLLDAEGKRRVSTTADDQGRFRLNVPEAGRYTVLADRIGFRRGDSVHVVVGAAAPPPLVLTLARQAQLLDSMLTVATGATPEPSPRQTEQLIVGHLRDDDTGQPVEGGKIDLLDGKRTVASKVSDQFGRFRMISPHPGKFSMVVERPGYKSAKQDAIQLRLGDTIVIDLRISRRVPILAPMTITASAKSVVGRHDSWAQDELFTRMRIYGKNKYANYVTRDSLDDYDERGFMTNQIIARSVKRDAPQQARALQGRLCSSDTGWYVDGLPWRGSEGEHLLDYYAPRDLELMEIYIWPAIPSDFVWGGLKPCVVIDIYRRQKQKK